MRECARSEENSFPVGEPTESGNGEREFEDFFGFAAVGAEDVEGGGFVCAAFGGEGEAGAVGGPFGRRVGAVGGGELTGDGAGRGTEEPEVGGRGILREVVVLDGEDEARAVGGEIKGAGAADGPNVFGGDGAELGCRRGLGGAEEHGRGEQSKEGEAGQTAYEGGERGRSSEGENGNDYEERERLSPRGFLEDSEGGENFAGGILTRSGRRPQRATRKLGSTRAFAAVITEIVFIRRKVPRASPAEMNAASATCMSIASNFSNPRTMAPRMRAE